jgi:hypothetical protein
LNARLNRAQHLHGTVLSDEEIEDLKREYRIFANEEAEDLGGDGGDDAGGDDPGGDDGGDESEYESEAESEAGAGGEIRNNPMAYMDIVLDERDVRARRAGVADAYLRQGGSPDTESMSAADLRIMFKLYDAIFFDKAFKSYFRSNRLKLDFSFSDETGIYVSNKSYEIEIDKNEIDELCEVTKAFSGKVFQTKVMCLQQILEFQLIRLLLKCFNGGMLPGKSGWARLTTNIFGKDKINKNLREQLLH